MVDPSSAGYNMASNPLCASFGSTSQSVYSFSCTSGVVGARYVSVQLMGNDVLTLCEVQVCRGVVSSLLPASVGFSDCF